MNKKTETKIRPVILSGGFGKRLWPVSRDNYPKQFTKLLSGESLFLSTLKRVSDRSRYTAPIIVGNIEHITFILVDLSLLGITDATVILEPCGRNTASAAILAALYEKDKDTLHLVMPSDHLIADEQAFHDTVLQCVPAALHNHIVLFGIPPTHPDTGYGYIIPGEEMHKTGLCNISFFSEKPDTTFARALINQGALWNSGIFFYKPEIVRGEARILAETHYRKCQTALRNALHEQNCILVRLEDYSPMENHAFDKLIMEHTKRGAVLSCSMGWNDIGSWYALWQIAEKDEDGNALSGAVTVKDVSNSYILSDGVPVAALGMKDCLIITRDDHVLVAERSKAQEVKELLPFIEKGKKRKNGVACPWGTHKKIATGENYQVKLITVYPGCATSLQRHKHRTEHWTVLSGTAKAECEGETKILLPDETFSVPQGARHRLSNPGSINTEIIEVQSGNYLKDDDIIRFEDLYGRV